jgi:hypothetical protein
MGELLSLVRVLAFAMLIILPAAFVWWILLRPGKRFSLLALFVLVTVFAVMAALLKSQAILPTTAAYIYFPETWAALMLGALAVGAAFAIWRVSQR